MLTGRVEQGTLKGGESVEIVGVREKPLKAQIGALEMFRKTLDEAQAGDQVNKPDGEATRGRERQGKGARQIFREAEKGRGF